MKALVLVDIQNDFLPGGALAVPDGDAVIAVANAIQSKFDLVVATQDWHPPNHGSFADNHQDRVPGDLIVLNGQEQVLWPRHCVQNTKGADFPDDLQRSCWSRVFPKGTDPAVDSYSGFFDNGQRSATGLHEYLKSCGVMAVYVMGLATDYCVKFTALDACRLGFDTFLITDGCRGVELHDGDVDNAIAEMTSAGVMCVTTAEIGR